MVLQMDAKNVNEFEYKMKYTFFISLFIIFKVQYITNAMSFYWFMSITIYLGYNVFELYLYCNHGNRC